MDKTNLRQWAKKERKIFDIKQISKSLVKKIESTDIYKTSKNIMIYYPLEFEINLLELLDDETKNFYLPKINGENMECCPYNKDCNLTKSCFNTQEPCTKPCDKNILDLIIVPALACDKNNYRLGYGGGFYDRFLKDLNTYTIACVPKQLIVENIFPEKHDIPINLIISD